MKGLFLFLLPLALFAKPTLEEKVGQLLLVHFNGAEFNDDAKRLMDEAHVGGFIYYIWANELSSPDQVKSLSNGLQSYTKIPLLIAVDQEGGWINRLKKGFVKFPGNRGVAKTKKSALKAKLVASYIGDDLKRVGINMNLAPVVDVDSNPSNPIINQRSFGPDPKQVARLGGQALEGYSKAGIIATLKHFPGHGDTETDSHLILPLIKKSRAQLNKTELYPFRELAHKAPAILTAHLMVPAVDPVYPVTFSKTFITDILRKELGFGGVILTDSLAMQGILEEVPSVDEAAIRSLEAGHDIVVLGGKQLIGTSAGFEITVDDVIRIHGVIVDAVRSGRLSLSAINASYARIQKLKSTLPGCGDK